MDEIGHRRDSASVSGRGDARSATPTSGLVANGLSLGYAGAPLFADLDLTVARGETLAIIGRSGCGKTSLLHVLAGLLRPDRGQVTLDGRDITGRPGHCSLMPQENLLLPWRNLLDNAALALEIAGHSREDARARAREGLPRFGLEGQGDRYPHQASGGMQQRVALLRSCLHESSVLLLDEPFGALDALTRRELQRWFADLVEELGLAAVLVTHDIEEALELASRLLVFGADGSLLEQALPATGEAREALRRTLPERL